MSAVTVMHHCRAVRGAAAVPMMPTAAAVSAQDETAPEDHGDDEDGRGDGNGRCGDAVNPEVSVALTPAFRRRFRDPRCYCERFGGGFDCLLRCFSHTPSLTSPSGWPLWAGFEFAMCDGRYCAASASGVAESSC
jgi:hypothetical protein